MRPLCALLALAWGCDDNGYTVAVTFSPPGLADQVTRVEISVVRDCGSQSDAGEPPLDAMGTITVVRGSAATGLGDLEPGNYGLYARGWTGACIVVASGCAPIHVEAGGASTLAVELVPVRGPGCEPGTRCHDGVCEQAADGGCLADELCNEQDDDCNGEIDDGFDLTADVTNCGRCANVCPDGANATAACTGGVCGFACEAGYGDCNDSLADGCETDLSIDVDNCGSCGARCERMHALPECAPDGAETVRGCTYDAAAGCDANYGDDDASVSNGCEACANGATDCPWTCGPSTAPSTCADAVRVAAGGSHTCAVDAEDQLRCWGNNAFLQLGRDGTERWAPVAVALEFDRVGAVALGAGHSCAISDSGSGNVYCWGDNAYAQLGDADNDAPRTAAFGVKGDSGLPLTARLLAAGDAHTCATSLMRAVWCWGDNRAGQLGNAATAEPTSAVAVRAGSLIGAISLAAGALHTCAVIDDNLDDAGRVYCWGNNNLGQIGTGGVAPATVPTQVAVLGDNVATVTAGAEHTCAALTTGEAYCWGKNDRGQLGDGMTTTRYEPGLVGITASVASVGAGDNFTCALDTDGDVWCWGANDRGQLGDGTLEDSIVPVQAAFIAGAVVEDETTLAVGAGHACVAVARGTAIGGVACWGVNDHGQLGTLSDHDARSPVATLP